MFAALIRQPQENVVKHQIAHLTLLLGIHLATHLKMELEPKHMELVLVLGTVDNKPVQKQEPETHYRQVECYNWHVCCVWDLQNYNVAQHKKITLTSHENSEGPVFTFVQSDQSRLCSSNYPLSCGIIKMQCLLLNASQSV